MAACSERLPVDKQRKTLLKRACSYRVEMSKQPCPLRGEPAALVQRPASLHGLQFPKAACAVLRSLPVDSTRHSVSAATRCEWLVRRAASCVGSVSRWGALTRARVPEYLETRCIERYSRRMSGLSVSDRWSPAIMGCWISQTVGNIRRLSARPCELRMTGAENFVSMYRRGLQRCGHCSSLPRLKV